MISYKVEGDKHLIRALERIKGKVEKKVARSALGKGATIATRQIKRAVPADLKGLRKSIGRRSKTYKHSGTIVIVIGPRFAWRDPKTGKQPSAEALKIEYGDETTPARPFMRRAFSSSKAEIETAIRKGAWEGIRREAAKK